MPNTTFDPRVETGGVNLFKGEFTKVEVRHPAPFPHHLSNRVIDPTKPFNVRVEWKVTGGETGLRMNAVGDWSIFLYAESMGPGPEIRLNISPSTVARGTPATPAMNWAVDVTVQPNQLSENLPTSGVYKLIVVVFANAVVAGGHDVIGYYEEPVMILAEDPE